MILTARSVSLRRPLQRITSYRLAWTKPGPAGDSDEQEKTTTSEDKSKPAVRGNYYEVLGVSHDATSTEIREAFYNKAKQLHPDVNASPLAKMEFAIVQEAFEVLKHPRNRELYNTRNDIEQSELHKAEDVEMHWMTKRKVGPRLIWSEKLAKDMMNASLLRAQIRRQRRPGDPPVLTLHQLLKKKEEPMPDLLGLFTKGSLPFKDQLKTKLAKVGGLCLTYVLAAYLYVMWTDSGTTTI